MCVYIYSPNPLIYMYSTITVHTFNRNTDVQYLEAPTAHMRYLEHIMRSPNVATSKILDPEPKILDPGSRNQDPSNLVSLSHVTHPILQLCIFMACSSQQECCKKLLATPGNQCNPFKWARALTKGSLKNHQKSGLLPIPSTITKSISKGTTNI